MLFFFDKGCVVFGGINNFCEDYLGLLLNDMMGFAMDLVSMLFDY